jgi:hypothetical protein
MLSPQAAESSDPDLCGSFKRDMLTQSNQMVMEADDGFDLSFVVHGSFLYLFVVKAPGMLHGLQEHFALSGV